MHHEAGDFLAHAVSEAACVVASNVGRDVDVADDCVTCTARRRTEREGDDVRRSAMRKMPLVDLRDLRGRHQRDRDHRIANLLCLQDAERYLFYSCSA